ncbi:TIGR04561 family membrane protein [Mycoplasma capricolum]|uniref:TIGR04561 family membrane protein n=1 Tax=Mycoplasma capricolum TaxID=2095 RepID=UPI003DA23D5A
MFWQLSKYHFKPIEVFGIAIPFRIFILVFAVIAILSLLIFILTYFIQKKKDTNQTKQQDIQEIIDQEINLIIKKEKEKQQN